MLGRLVQVICEGIFVSVGVQRLLLIDKNIIPIFRATTGGVATRVRVGATFD